MLQQAECTTCSRQCATCNSRKDHMQHATDNMQRATCKSRHATGNIHHATGSVRRAPCRIAAPVECSSLRRRPTRCRSAFPRASTGPRCTPPHSDGDGDGRRVSGRSGLSRAGRAAAAQRCVRVPRGQRRGREGARRTALCSAGTWRHSAHTCLVPRRAGVLARCACQVCVPGVRARCTCQVCLPRGHARCSANRRSTRFS